MKKNKNQNLKLIGISVLFLMVTVIGVAAGYFLNRKTSGDITEQKVTELNDKSTKLTKLKTQFEDLMTDFNTKLVNLKIISKGETGQTGATGKPGLQGDIGKTGQAGANGKPGLQGDIGETGQRGLAGQTGKIGLQGDIGETGQRGLTGQTGTTGKQGLQGDAGARGAEGLMPDISQLEAKVTTKLTTVDLLTEFKKLISADADPELITKFIDNILKPGMKKMYFKYWVNINKNKFVYQTSDLSSNDKNKNKWWKLTSNIFENLKEANNYLFKQLTVGIDGNAYGLYRRINFSDITSTVYFKLLKSNQLISGGIYQKWNGFMLSGSKKTSSIFLQK